MIKVKKEFRFTPEDKHRLIDGAEFVGIKQFTDTYYDDPAYSLTSADRWLRKRDGVFQLNIGRANPRDAATEAFTYKELTDGNKIKRALGITGRTPLAEAFPHRGFEPCATFMTTREQYHRDGLILDLDETDFGFSVCEVKLMAMSAEDVSIAKAKIAAFATLYAPTHEAARGKVLEYIRRFRPKHFEALLVSGVDHRDQT